MKHIQQLYFAYKFLDMNPSSTVAIYTVQPKCFHAGKICAQYFDNVFESSMEHIFDQNFVSSVH